MEPAPSNLGAVSRGTRASPVSRSIGPLASNFMSAESVPLIDVGRFDQVDASDSPQDFIEWMAHQRRHGPDRALAMLGLTAENRVLDLGCGTGADLATLAELCAHPVGLDRSFEMLQATARLTSLKAPTLVNADGVALPFRNGCFDACWARLVLLHTPEPQRTLGEVARVVRPGGNVVLTEPDHGSHVVASSCPEIFERIKVHRRLSFHDPLVGRQLADLATTARLEVTKAWVTPILYRSLAKARAAGGPFDVAVKAAVADGAISKEEGTRYLESLEELDARRAFVFAGLAMSVALTVPGSPVT